MTNRIDDAIRTGEISRRQFLAGGTLAGFAAFLAACGTPAQSAGPAGGATSAPATPAGPAPTGGATTVPAPTGGGTLNFANWIGYIDIDDDNNYPTLEKFTAETGVEVNYQEDIDDNETFFTSDLEAPLRAGQSSGWDIVVVTDWMVARLVRLGWLETINTAATPNFTANLIDTYKGRSFDPDTNLAAPWQSGMTGIGHDAAATGPLSSLEVLYSDEYAGRVTYLSEMRDTIGLTAVKLGFDPATLTEEQFQEAIAEVDRAVKAGIPRQLAGNSYVDIMLARDAIVGMAWSGDVTSLLQPDQADNQDFQWVLPDEGGMLWTDNMVIPKGAEHKGQAELWINFYYDPANAATIEAYVNYVCPIKGAREAMLELDPSLAENTLIFPTEEMLARLHQFRATNADEEVRWAEDFSRVLGL